VQQLIFGMFVKTIKEWASQEHWDLRNEDTVLACKKIVETIDLHTRFI